MQSVDSRSHRPGKEEAWVGKRGEGDTPLGEGVLSVGFSPGKRGARMQEKESREKKNGVIVGGEGFFSLHRKNFFAARKIPRRARRRRWKVRVGKGETGAEGRITEPAASKGRGRLYLRGKRDGRAARKGREKTVGCVKKKRESLREGAALFNRRKEE